MTGARVPFLDLARQSRALRPELDRAVARVLERGWFVLGEEGAAFERAFAAHLGLSQGVGVNSGTDALMLALLALGVQPGEGVVVPAHTAVPTICAIVASGAVPVLADIEPIGFGLDPSDFERAVVAARRERRVAAVIPVHLYGAPARMPEILAIAERYDLAVVEDASQAHGTRIGPHSVGRFGAIGCFSFYPTKNLGALGDAGIAVTNDPELADRLRMLRNYGEESKYRNKMRGVNSRLDELQAAVLSAKLPHLDTWVERRRTLAARYDEALANLDLELPASDAGLPDATHSYHLYVVRSTDREGLRRRLADRGIDTAVHYPLPVHHQQAYHDLAGDFPEAERAAREVLSLPLYPELEDAEQDRVIEALRAECGRRRA
ncbi:MAG: DegT/DnrJ/EryC1/StrS family aminotransferase [Isosphaeraceae bacterium]|nr:DegT/DnrJ/EryC1/StrS family aminotransferase [Isosphaeraceae bacterium]